MKQKIQTLLNELNHGLVERDQTLKTALLTVLAGENLVLIGPPGTGKSLIARRIADSFSHENDNSYFEYLLTKFSTPEEIFGPLSISELKADRFKRNTTGYLPSVKIAFLDEIFKASSSILNALLTILNERLYHNGATAEKVPLQALIAASNELPTDQEELNALYDRFLVRSFVDYVSEDSLSLLFKNTQDQPIKTPITADELARIKNAVPAVTIPKEIAEAIQSIWIQHKETFKEDRRESLSDRRLKKVLHLLRVSAVTNGRNQVDLSDVLLLKDCLWNHQENAPKVIELIKKTLQRYNRQVPKNAGTTAALSTTMPAITARKTGQLHAKEKGYKGLGTAEDPILIGNAHDLMGLEDIGQKGYYFLQTANIDCNAITTWHNINLKGHYDGDGHLIQYKKVGDNYYALFQSIQAKSSVKNLELRLLDLAKNVTGSHIEVCVTNVRLIQENSTESTITDCRSDATLIGGTANGCNITNCKTGNSLIYSDARNCIITACQSDASIIGGSATDSDITACQSNGLLIGGNATNSAIGICQSKFLIQGVATNSTITDSLVVMDISLKVNDKGGVAHTLKSSTVMRCFVTGKIEGVFDASSSSLVDSSLVVSRLFGGITPLFINFSGITGSCDASTIRQCAIGKVKLTSARLSGRIAREIKNNSTLENNISIDSNSATQNDEKNDGKSISEELFKRRYFEHTLDWDFKTVWQWDTQKNHPVLRSVGVSAKTASPAKPVIPPPQKVEMVDILSLQICANIWL